MFDDQVVSSLSEISVELPAGDEDPTFVVKENVASMPISTAILSPRTGSTTSETGSMTGATTAATPPVPTIIACIARSRNRMQGNRRGDESPHCYDPKAIR